MKKQTQPRKSGLEPVTNSEERRKLNDARVLLITIIPHFQFLLNVAESHHKIAVYDCPEKIGTAATYPDGRIVFDRSFLAKLNNEETAFVIAHELGHHYLETFQRAKGIESNSRTHALINVASDTLINNYVAKKFETIGGFSKIRQSPNLVDLMWWEPQRLWDKGALCIVKNALNTAPFGSLIPRRPLEELSIKHLPDHKFHSIEAQRMEDVLFALTLFSDEADKLLGEKHRIEGNVLFKKKGALPFHISVHSTPSLVNKTLTFVIDETKINGDKKDIMDVKPELRFLYDEVDEHTHKREQKAIDLIFDLGQDGQPVSLNRPGEREFKLFFPPFLQGSMKITYQEDGQVEINGSFMIDLDGIGGGPGNGQVPGRGRGLSGDMRDKGELKDLDPDITDDEIERRQKELDEARREADGNVQGDGESLDMEVHDGIYNVPWQTYLQTWLDGYSRLVRTYVKPSRRGEWPNNTIAPGHKRIGYRLNILLDTSGSMIDLLPDALGAIASFCETNAVDRIDILECDEHLQDIKEDITTDELRNYQVKGCRGTDMTPGMMAFAQNPEVTAVIIITDGEIDHGYLPKDMVPYEVLWCLVGRMHHWSGMPYGKQVHI